MGAEGDKGAGWTTMKIDPEIFQELGVRDPEETKREVAISKRARQVRKELKDKPDDIDLQLELGRLGNFELSFPGCGLSSRCVRVAKASICLLSNGSV